MDSPPAAYGVTDLESAERRHLDLLEALQQNQALINELKKSASPSSLAPPTAPSSFHCVPNEILIAIFEECLPKDRNPALSPKDAPILLTLVSKTWCEVARSTPRLWTRLHITGPILHENGQDNPKFSPADTAKIETALVRRARAANEWLSRAGHRPLSVSFFFKFYPSRTPSADPPPLSHFVNSMFSLVASLSHTLYSLDIIAPYHVVLGARKPLAGQSFPHLGRLRIHTNREMTQVPQPLPLDALHFPAALLFAPNIKELTLDIVAVSASITPSLKLPENWKSLTFLSFHFRVNALDIYPVMKHCPALITLRLNNIVDHVALTGGEPTFYEAICLPHLKTLHLRFPFQNRNRETNADRIFSLLEAPALEEIVYVQNIRATTTEVFPIINLLSRTPKLLRCLLISPDIHIDVITTVLDLISGSLTHLTIGGSPWAETWHKSAAKRIQVNAQQDDVDGIGQDDDSLADEDDDGLELLRERLSASIYQLDALDLRNLVTRLRALESLTILDPPISYSDEGLLALIIDRIALWQAREVALLRNIRINFNRPRQRDISGDVRAVSMAAGASVSMKLSYKKPPKKPKIPLSPYLGAIGQIWDKDPFE